MMMMTIMMIMCVVYIRLKQTSAASGLVRKKSWSLLISRIQKVETASDGAQSAWCMYVYVYEYVCMYVHDTTTTTYDPSNLGDFVLLHPHKRARSYIHNVNTQSELG